MTATDRAYPLPCIHLNGTGRKALHDQYASAYVALEKAIDLLADGRPHMRDYYPLGEQAYILADAEYRRRLVALEQVSAALVADWTALDDHTAARLG